MPNSHPKIRALHALHHSCINNPLSSGAVQLLQLQCEALLNLVHEGRHIEVLVWGHLPFAPRGFTIAQGCECELKTKMLSWKERAFA